MAAPTTAVDSGMAPTQAEPSSQRRVNWSSSNTETLIRLWEDNLRSLRSNSRNARIYEEMTRDLNSRLPAGEVSFTTEQVRQKFENFKQALPVPEVNEAPAGADVLATWEEN
ncbi:hypothetical protein HPB51_026766 [Rhipicephalus microplus]|uniref:Myb/SANT-like DNA-binding domain-containing protein n=1 Tax=Rhipicephalus microplus TaxID=6941 RepID=A0A9J6D299_RHIMP|nr:hypothetical protein HPB51_026766 [Rhipicephalus microplus]